MIFQLKTKDVLCGGADKTSLRRIPFRVCYVTTTEEDFTLLKKLLRFSLSCPVTPPLCSALHTFSAFSDGITELPDGVRPLERKDSSAVACFKEALQQAGNMLVTPCYPVIRRFEDLRGRTALSRSFRRTVWLQGSRDACGIDCLSLNLPERTISNMCVACVNVLTMQSGDCSPGCPLCRSTMLLTVAEDHYE